jgi:hypothetical protein
LFDTINYLAEKSISVSRFWVYRFVHRHNEKRAVRRTKYPEKERHKVSAEDFEAYFASIAALLTPIPSESFLEC